MSHHVAADVTKYNHGGAMEKLLESQNIIVNRQLIPATYRRGGSTPTPEG
jgi:glycine/serine hydroxymethyltransferase